MRISKIAWSNFRHLADGAIRTGPQVVFIGPNETGKSSILRFCDACLGFGASSLPQLFSMRDFANPGLPLSFELTFEDFSADDIAAFPDEISPGPPDQMRICLEVVLDEDGEVSSARRYFPESGHERGPSRAQLARFGWSYVPAHRSPSRELGFGRTAAVRSVLSDLDLSADETTFRSALDAYQSALDTSAAIAEFRQDFADSLSESLPRTVQADDLRLEPQAAYLSDPVAGVTVTLSDGAQRAPLAEQSDGVRAIATLSAFGMRKQSAAITAVDEPETHLHPTAQQSVAQRLLARSGQTLLATHSADIVASASPHQIVVFAGGKAPRQLPASSTIHSEDQVVRYWSHRLLRPLTARSILAVEGPADRILCEAVARLHCWSLARVGVQIFELDGASFFAKAYDLFGPRGFDLKVTGLVDQDHEAEWATAIGCSPASLNQHGIFVAAPDLEGVYAAAFGKDRLLHILTSSSYFSVMGVCSAVGKGNTAALDIGDLARFCGHKKRKVRAALAVAASMTLAEAQTLVPLMNALGVAYS